MRAVAANTSVPVRASTLRLAAACVFFLAGALSACAQPAAPGAPCATAAAPLASFLRPDGTLRMDAGFTGSIDPAGWRLVAGPNDEPRFVAASMPAPAGEAADERWNVRFAFPGVDGTVNALAKIGPDLYVAGFFREAGGVPANSIARWDGVRWHALGSGVTYEVGGLLGTVHCLAVDETKLYVGGGFAFAGGRSADNLAVWNGSEWSGVLGLDGEVMALAVATGGLYVGGEFILADAAAVNHVALWNGVEWTGLETGLAHETAPTPAVHGMAVSGSSVYVVGEFTTAGNVAATNIAVWDGVRWSPVGGGFDATAYAVAVAGTNVYAGGDFTSAGGVPVGHVARWNGAGWSGLGEGVDAAVLAIAVDGTNLCVGGDFLTAGSVTANGVACWDGTGWSAVGGGVAHEFSGSASVTALATDGETLFVGGDFTLAGEARAHSVAGRSGGQWHALGNGLNAAVTAMAVSGTNVYVGGDFTTAGGLAVNHIARWNGNAWSAMGSGLRDAFAPLPYVGAIAVSGDDVYVGGAFTHAGGVGVANIARWDGTTWHGLGSGLSGWVAALATQGPVVYAGGAFTAAGGVAAAGIALWDGSDWSALSDGLDDWVRAIAVGGSNVYAGGDFKFAGNVEARHVARWDGMAWSALGGGLSDVCRALAVSGTNLYVGGDFLLAGGVAAARVARWNGADWAALGSGLDGACRALACTGDVVYAAGEFLAAGDAPANRVAAWNGTEWSPLGSGLTVGWTAAPRANALALGPTNLFAGGDFLWAGDAPSRAFAAWSLEPTGARLMALPRTISAAAVRGHNPPAQSLEIWSSDTNALTYVLESRAAWLAVDPQSGSTTGEHDTVGLVFDAASLDFGDYATAVTVTSAEAANSPMTVPVHLSVRGPRIACGTNSLAATIRQGEPLPEFRMEVWNAGVDVLDYTVEDDAVWLSPDPAGGSSTGEHDTVTLRLEPTAITSGTWLATVTLASPFAENSPRTVSVSLTVTPVIADTDGDGLPDYWEERYGGNPTGMAPHAHLDSDNADNLSEFISGTDPTNGQSYLGIRQAWVLSPPAGTGTVVRWSSVPGRYYRLQRSTNLLMDPFTHSVHTGIPAGLVENTVTDATAQGASPRFYRIRVEP